MPPVASASSALAILGLDVESNLIPFLHEAAPYLPPNVAVPLAKEGVIDLANFHKELV